jgi:hypothetical protein
MYHIQNLPAPPPIIQPVRKSKFPYDQLQPGQSFVIPREDITSVQSVRSNTSQQGQKLKVKFRVAQLLNGDVQVYRVIEHAT